MSVKTLLLVDSILIIVVGDFFQLLLYISKLQASALYN